MHCEDEDEEMDIEEEGPYSKEEKEKLRFLRFRERLFQEYEAQRNEPLLYDCLHAPGSSNFGCVLAAPQHRHTSISRRLRSTAGKLRRFQQACSGFEEALQKFRNLQKLEVDLSLSHSDEVLYWHLHTIDVEYGDFYGVDEEQAIAEEAAPLAFILRALGKRSASSNSLVSLELRLIGDPWWGLQDLEEPWIPPEPEVDNEGILSPLSQVVLKTNVALMDDAFAYLTDIRVKFHENDEMRQFMQELGRLLTKASRLTHLELDFSAGRFELPRWQGFDLLTDINSHAMLSKITNLCLTRFHFSESSLLHTLSHVASSLRSLTLRGCRLLGEDTWSHCYEGMRLIPFQVLDYLDFRECKQEVEHEEIFDTPSRDWSEKDVYARSVVMHHMSYSLHTRVGYSSDIYDYILKRTEHMPPLQKFDEGNVEPFVLLYGGSKDDLL